MQCIVLAEGNLGSRGWKEGVVFVDILFELLHVAGGREYTRRQFIPHANRTAEERIFSIVCSAVNGPVNIKRMGVFGKPRTTPKRLNFWHKLTDVRGTPTVKVPIEK